MPAILVNDVSPVISYTATAGQTLFSIPFEFFAVQDIVVERAGVTLTYSPTPANNNQFSVIGANLEGGGSITLGSPGATLGDKIVIFRDIAIERLANYPETGPMAVRSLNAEQAKHIGMMQQLERDVNRSVTVPIGESSIDLPSAAERAEKILTFDAAGVPVADFDIGLLTGAVISSGAAPVQNIEFTATASQTVFNFVYDAIPTYVSVFLNGVKLPTSDFTHSGTTVTLLTPATVGDRVALEGFTQSAVLEALATLGLSTGAGLVGFSHANTYTAETVGAKFKDIVSVKDAPYNAKGDGVTDDTAAIQAALSSGAKEVIFPAGGTYLVNGGLAVSTSGQHISAYGATIKLKNSASTKWIIGSTATDVVFSGGTYDGNKANGNGSGDTYASYGIALLADRCTVQDIRSINTYGMGIKGFGNYLSALNNRISNTTHYGIFFDGSASVSHTGNRAIGNTIDMSEGQVTGGQNIGQGILFTAGAGQEQTAWELSSNNIIGPQTTVQDQAINLGVRGNNGIVSNNTTRYGAMGFSEGGANTVITGNRFLNLVGTFRIGIEPSGKFIATGNIVTDAYVGIDCTATISYDSSLVSGNQITVASGGSNAVGVRFQIVAGQSGKNVNISGNSINTPGSAVYVVLDCEGLSITGNTFVGPGVGSGRGVFFDTVQTAVLASIIGNTFNGFLRPWSVYSLASTTFTDLYAANNNCVNCGSSQATWPVEGSAVIGARACVLGAQSGLRDTIDVATNVFTLYSTSYNNPEGLLTAGIGSIHNSLNASGGAYRKNTGTGNTGWVAL